MLSSWKLIQFSSPIQSLKSSSQYFSNALYMSVSLCPAWGFFSVLIITGMFVFCWFPVTGLKLLETCNQVFPMVWAFFCFLHSVPSNALLKSFPWFLWLILFSCSWFSSWFPVWHNDQANLATQLYHFFSIFWWIQTEPFCDCSIFCSTSC